MIISAITPPGVITNTKSITKTQKLQFYGFHDETSLVVLNGLFCPRLPLGSTTKLCQAHSIGQASQQLTHTQHKKQILGKRADGRLLQGAVG